jgi:5-amino-6-(5-phosphoribosylamino)uracil reductase
MRSFDVLFDRAESSSLEDPAYAAYGKLGFPAAPPDRPWTFSNFVQSLDGIVSFKGEHAAGADISRSAEDRWLMDLLRAHADAVILGINTLLEETALGERERGPVFRIIAPELRQLRQRLGRRREMNIFVTGSASLDLSAYRAFDGEFVDPVVITTRLGAARLAEKKTHPHLRVFISGEKDFVNLPEVVRMLRRELGIEYLLCEGGPTLYGYLARAGLIDEKFVTLSPVEVGQQIPPEQKPAATERNNPPKFRPTIFGAPGFTVDTAPWWEWISCRKVGEHQFSRYRKAVSSS